MKPKNWNVVLLPFCGVGAAVAASVALRSLAAARKRIAELEEEMEACPARLVKIEDLSPGGSFDPAAAIEEHERRAWRRVEENDRHWIEKERAERER